MIFQKIYRAHYKTHVDRVFESCDYLLFVIKSGQCLVGFVAVATLICRDTCRALRGNSIW